MYQTILDEIFHAYPMYHKVGDKAYKEGLENIEELMAIVGNPATHFKTVHVAGTNGKGSVSHLLASFFQESGYKTGLFTSPHLVDFKERIKINGVEISEAEVVAFFNQYNQAFQAISPSFFEMTVALAFDYFRKKKVDIAIIEVGLGGRFDSTNIITPELSIITNISLEHTALLGNTVEKIAHEKAGIIKENVPILIGEYDEDSFPVFSATAKLKNTLLLTTENVEIVTINDENSTNNLFQTITITKNDRIIGKNIHTPLLGQYQLKNIKTFVSAALYFCQKNKIPPHYIISAIENIISNVNFQGRWQVIKQKPLTICDVGHNLACFKEIINQLHRTTYKKLHCVIGFAHDKDIESILALLPEKNATYYICRANIERMMTISEIENIIQHTKLTYLIGGTVSQSYDIATQNADIDDVVLICGSNFIIGELFHYLRGKLK